MIEFKQIHFLKRQKNLIMKLKRKQSFLTFDGSYVFFPLFFLSFFLFFSFLSWVKAIHAGLYLNLIFWSFGRLGMWIPYSLEIVIAARRLTPCPCWPYHHYSGATIFCAFHCLSVGFTRLSMLSALSSCSTFALLCIFIFSNIILWQMVSGYNLTTHQEESA